MRTSRRRRGTKRARGGRTDGAGRALGLCADLALGWLGSLGTLVLLGSLVLLGLPGLLGGRAEARSEGDRDSAATGETDGRPHVLLVVADDLGIGDVGAYGTVGVRTPRIDRFAREGMRFDDFSVPSSICCPSRAALMTGRYAQRCGVTVPCKPGDPSRPRGLDPDERTLADRFRAAGYATACIGKWHLGQGRGHHPLDRGFDRFFGMPWNYNQDPTLWRDRERIAEAGRAELATLDDAYVREAVRFLDDRGDRPFFLYLSFQRPHGPCVPSPEFAGRSRADVYGDVIEELDAAFGRVLDALAERDLARDTLVLFLSDNGPAMGAVRHFDSGGGLRGAKGTTDEGGHRVPFLARWPGHVPAGATCDATVSSLDLAPTLARLAGEPTRERPDPEARPFDGIDIRASLFGEAVPPASASPRELFYYNGMHLQAVRSGRFKLHLAREKSQTPPWQREFGYTRLDEPVLFDLAVDPAERVDVVGERPDVVRRLTSLAASARAELGDVPRGRPRSVATHVAAGRRPNVVLFLVDDLGFADLGCYGNADHVTPRIDALAAAGVRFTSFYAMPACSATRATIQTGQCTPRTGITDFIEGHWRRFAKLAPPEIATALDPNARTTGHLLAAAGYATGYVGKWHLGRGAEAGPDHFGYATTAFIDRTSRSREGGGPKEIDRITDRAIEIVDASADRPFFLTIAHYAVHLPFESSPETLARHRRRREEAREERGARDATGATGATDALARSDPRYAAMLEELDRGVGGFLDALAERGLAEDTIVVLTSDNGGVERLYHGVGPVVTRNDPLRGQKGTLYEGGIRVPMIVRWPGVAGAGSTCDALTTTADLLPTFRELGRAPSPPQTVDGKSLVALLRGEVESVRESLGFHYPHYHHGTPAGAIRRGPLKLIERFEDGRLELYDLAADPGETEDLAAARPADAARLRAELVAWRQRVGARPPLPNPEHDPSRAEEWWSRRDDRKIDVDALRRRYESRGE